MSTPFDRHEMVRICREHGIGREAFLKVKPLVLAAAERDTALLRQALEALELRCGTNADERKELIPALRERLGVKEQA